jgi:hypothetical protein
MGLDPQSLLVFPANNAEEQVDHNAIHSFVLVDVGIAMAKIRLVPLLQSVACVAMMVVIVPRMGEVVVVE